MPTQLPQIDSDDLEVFLILGLCALFLALLKYLQNRALPASGETPGVQEGGWTYLRGGWAMKALALLFGVLSVMPLIATYHLLQDDAFGAPWEDPKAQLRARGAGVFMMLLYLGIASFMAFAAASLVCAHMRYTDQVIVFRSTFGRETAIPWEDVLEINLSVAYPILSYKGWRRKDLCDTCPGYREFLDYARARGIRIVEPTQQD